MAGSYFQSSDIAQLCLNRRAVQILPNMENVYGMPNVYALR